MSFTALLSCTTGREVICDAFVVYGQMCVAKHIEDENAKKVEPETMTNEDECIKPVINFDREIDGARWQVHTIKIGGDVDNIEMYSSRLVKFHKNSPRTMLAIDHYGSTVPWSVQKVFNIHMDVDGSPVAEALNANPGTLFGMSLDDERTLVFRIMDYVKEYQALHG